MGDLFNVWGKPWWHVYLSTFTFIISSLVVGFLTICVFILAVDKFRERRGKDASNF